MINLTIDNSAVAVEPGTTILEAARSVHVDVPHLCHMEGLKPFGVCRLCTVDVEGEFRLAPACMREVREGMVVYTNSPRVRKARQLIMELLLADHAGDCRTCSRARWCEFRNLASQLGITEVRFESGHYPVPIDMTSPAVVRDPQKCILCGRCVRVCADIQGVHAIGFVKRGAETRVSTYDDQGLGNSPCTNCGQCIHACPVGALREQDNTFEVWEALGDPTRHVVVQAAPAVRASIAEALGEPAGTLATGKMYAALRRLGFDGVFDTNFAADLTIIEEATELLTRVKEGGKLPLITSCCPGWIKFMEHFYPDLAPHVSTCKSPQQMFGALAKSYYAEQRGLDPGCITCVSIMPCTAKKFEADRPEMCDSGFKDVDHVLTTREFAQMIQNAGLDFMELPDEEPDPLMASYTGAATIFGSTGGVMEAAVRTAYKYITGVELEQIDVAPVRGMEGIRAAELKVGDMNIGVAVAHGLGNARKLLDEIRAGTSKYHFVEIMACPGGCIGGGGQPIGFDMETRRQRAEALYKEDAGLPRRRSHENQEVCGLYDKFLGDPNSPNAHRLLHTQYRKRLPF